MNTNPITDEAALGRLRQTGDHEWTVAGETYPDYSSAMNAARAALATEHADECDARADELEARTGNVDRGQGWVNGEIRTPHGLRLEARAYRRKALDYVLDAPR